MLFVAAAVMAQVVASGVWAADPPKAGELVTLNAVHQQWVQDQLWCGQGEVHITYQDVSLRCDEIEVDLTTMGLKAWWDYGADKLHGGWTGYIFLIVMVIVSMIITAIINSYYRSKQATS